MNTIVPIEQVKLNFSAESLQVLNIVIGFIMFGISLDLKISDFKWVMVNPKGTIIGLVSQFLILPFVTFLLTLALNPPPSIALGMILVAACPGGNLSNFLTHYSKGNTALSVCMTAISTVIAMFMTPINLTFWGSMNPATKPILKEVQLSGMDMFYTIVFMLGIPLVLGLFISHKYPKVAEKAKLPMKIFAIGFFSVFVILALSANFQHFINYAGVFMFVVFLHNAFALLSGYATAKLFGLPDRDRRAVAIEVGIQNSGLGLILIFNFFNGMGGMAIIAAWWGVWHVISGLAIGTYWSRKIPREVAHG